MRTESILVSPTPLVTSGYASSDINARRLCSHVHSLQYLLLCDAGKGKALAYTGVPADLAKRMPAGEWLKAALDVLGGKGGGKPTIAQGQGPHIHKLSEAMDAAKAHANRIMSSQ